MSKSKRNILILLVFVLLALSFWVYSNLEWVEKQIDLGPAADIKRQDFIAAQRFLEKLDVQLNIEKGFTRLDAPLNGGYDAENHLPKDLEFSEINPEENTKKENPKYFPSTDDLIVIGDGFAALSELRTEKLLDWVDSGGRLIVTATNPFLSSTHQRPDYVFDEFGVYPVTDHDIEGEDEVDAEGNLLDKNNAFTNEENQGEKSQDEGKSSEDELKPWNPQNRCNLLSDNLLLTIAEDVEIDIGLNTSQSLSFDEDNEENFFFWASNDLGIQIIQARHGSGVVTFLSNIDAWKNDYIACFDNAYFLRFFAANYQQVWFLVNTDSPSLVDLVWEKYPYLLLTFCILVILSVWHYGQRFGRMKPVQPFDRRKILEHIEASSLFLWRQKSTRWLLVDAVQHSIRKKMRIRHAAFDGKSWLEQCEMIAKTTQVPVHEVKTSMLELSEEVQSQTLTEQSFIILMKSLKRIEGKL